MIFFLFPFFRRDKIVLVYFNGNNLLHDFSRSVFYVDSAKNECVRVVFLCVVSVLIAIFFRIYFKELYQNINVMLTRFPAFFVGVGIGKAAYEGKGISVNRVRILLLVVFIFAWPLHMVYVPILRVYISAALNGGICFVGLLFLDYILNYEKKGIILIVQRIQEVLEWFGKYTIELYLIHVLVRKIMGYWGIMTYSYSNEIKLIIVSIVLSVIAKRIVMALNRILQCRLKICKVKSR